jgi:type II secretory ATPase GspE/PulE/Tfp pilus assembly ATPase PilB-like protein
MGIEPYLLRSGILGILNQRLARRLCSCARPAQDPTEYLGLAIERAHVAAGCPHCLGTGYRGRLVIAEMLRAEPNELGRAILSRSDAAQLEQLAERAGMITRWQRAQAAVASGEASPAEIRRVLGFTGGNAPADG